MPAGRGDRCEDCYWTNTARKRIDLDLALFSRPRIATEFARFGNWLIHTVGPHKAALSIHRYSEFFERIENDWGRIPEYCDLLGRFGAEGLRRVRLPMRWLRETHGIDPDPDARDRDSERRQIEKILSTIPEDSPGGLALRQYNNALIERTREGTTSLRSIRLALRPAAALILVAGSDGALLPAQATLNRYLASAPGQKSAATGFCNFLRIQYGIELTAVVDPVLRRRWLETEIVKASKSAMSDPRCREQWIRLGIEYFHGRRASRALIRKARVNRDGDNGLLVEINDDVFWLPDPRSTIDGDAADRNHEGELAAAGRSG